MKTLNITLKKKWFDMIASGEKKEEYREIKPYWQSRLCCGFPTLYSAKDFDIVSANNGYAKDCPNIKWEHKGTRIGEGKQEWGAVPGVKYFILDIGDILKP
jgi:hypothetical protein